MRYVDMPQDERVLEFPTPFPVKAMGKPTDDIQSVLIGCFEKLGVEFAQSSIQHAKSSTGKFVSVTAIITAQSRKQLDDIYEYLAAHPAVLMTL